MLKVIELFSGIGAQAKALERLGIDFEVVAISEIDKFAIKSYEAIHGEANNLGDITKIKTEDVPDCDLLTYSFPCQDISVAGKQKGLEKNSDTRSSLLWECERIIEAKRPKYLLLENVKNLVGKKHRANFDKWLDVLDGFGYNNYWQVLNAKDYGVPQNRERVFVVSILKEFDDGTFNFPEKQELKIALKDLLEENVGEKFYLSKKKDGILEEKEEFGRFGRQGCETFNENIETIKNGDTINAFNKSVNNSNISPTITTRPDGFKTAILTVENFRIRKLTPLECWRLMGFDDGDFYTAEKVNSNAQLYKQAGNSIVVNVLEAIFKNMLGGSI